MVLKELRRLSEGLVNRSFCRLNISRVQRKFSWQVGKELLASDSKTVWKSRVNLNLSKAGLIFLMVSLKIHSFRKNELRRSLGMMSCCTPATPQTVRWPCETIILLFTHFESSTEVQLNSWWMTASLWSITVW